MMYRRPIQILKSLFFGNSSALGSRTDIEGMTPVKAMPFDGERFTTTLTGTIENEHIHRYLFAYSYCANKDVLDISSGEGYGSALLSKTASSVTGVDASPEAVAHANNSYKSPNLKYLVGSCQNIPAADASFDTVVSFETIEHIKEHEIFMDQISRVLRPNGLLLISTPDHQVYSEECGVQNPYHLRELRHHEFVNLLKSKFKFVSMMGQKSTAGSIIAPLEKDLDRPGSHSIEIFNKRSYMNYGCAPFAIGSPFLLALSSNSPFTPLPVAILDDPGLIPNFEQNIIPSLLNKIKQLELDLSLHTNKVDE